MATQDDLRGYGRKRRLGLVPHSYPPKHLMKGVQPPIGVAEARRLQDEAASRRSKRSADPVRG